jgi:hypothetical protein
VDKRDFMVVIVGWTFQRIGAHFDVGLERARQLVRLNGYSGKRGQATAR